MKITTKQLRQLIREAIQKEMFGHGEPGGELGGSVKGLSRGPDVPSMAALTPEDKRAVMTAAKSDPALRAALQKLGLLKGI